MNHHRTFSLHSLAASLLVATFAVTAQAPETPSCQSNIVSATVVATFCGHVVGSGQTMGLLILWRGQPGWFQRREGGRSGGGGSRQFGAGTKGQVSQSATYGSVTIDFDGDFDANIVTLGEASVPLKGVNTITNTSPNSTEPVVVPINATCHGHPCATW